MEASENITKHDQTACSISTAPALKHVTRYLYSFNLEAITIWRLQASGVLLLPYLPTTVHALECSDINQ